MNTFHDVFLFFNNFMVSHKIGSVVNVIRQFCEYLMDLCLKKTLHASV